MDNPHNIIVDRRPWGGFRQLTQNEPVTVKIITVNAGKAFSLQYHKKRDEFWCILSGKAEVTVGDTTIPAQVNQEFYISANTKHRLKALEGDVSFLEISFGQFDETDIVRLEDK